MSYDLAFLPSALKEWRKLGATVRGQFKKKLAERLVEPRVDSDTLSGMPDCYKIKLRAAGYRLVYRVEDQTVTVVVISVGKRERNAVYKAAAKARGRLTHARAPSTTPASLCRSAFSTVSTIASASSPAAAYCSSGLS